MQQSHVELPLEGLSRMIWPLYSSRCRTPRSMRLLPILPPTAPTPWHIWAIG